ncbi:hypothetical protein P692DRAFT_201666478, partial [Suillus brevipes Sb2]
RKIGRDVKIAAMKLYEDAHMSKDNIIHCVGFSESTFWRTLKLWRETGDCAGVSYKKLRRIAKERNELRRAEFVARMAQYQPEEIGFLDETSKDERTPGRAWGRAKCGKRAESQQPFVRGSQVSALGLLTIDGMIASAVIEGSFTTVKFIEFLELTVLPLCQQYPGRLSVLVMDNAKIHHGEGVAEMI